MKVSNKVLVAQINAAATVLHTPHSMSADQNEIAKARDAAAKFLREQFEGKDGSR